MNKCLFNAVNVICYIKSVTTVCTFFLHVFKATFVVFEEKILWVQYVQVY